MSRQASHDQERLIDYGALKDIPAQILHSIDDAQDPQIVADVVADLIAHPRGTRPLRTTVGDDMGLASLNVAKAQIQQTVLNAWGLTEPLAFKIPSEVTTEK